MPTPLVVFSHLRWDFVYQRPQHLLSRLASRRPVLYIEEPVFTPDEPARWQFSSPAPGVTVCRPCTPVSEPGFSDAQLPALTHLLDTLIQRESLQEAVVWLYTPMALPLARRLRPRVTVYDCMDELSGFAFAPPQLIERERELLRAADLVFTGGPSLYRAKRALRPGVHCFPSSVEAAHFRSATGALAEPADQWPIPHPRLGYFGVIDERMDLDLLRDASAARPAWQFVLVGPVVKVDPAALPQAPNLHYLGQKPYDALPAYLAGWDACLLPFARNEATEFISPTKTLEYMAAEKPIVSTPITDVAEPYGDIVYLAEDAEAFVRACEQALYAGEPERAQRTRAMRDVLARTSWDETAARMEALLEGVVSGAADEQHAKWEPSAA